MIQVSDSVRGWVMDEHTKQLVNHLQTMRDAVISELTNANDMSAGATARLLGRVNSLDHVIACMRDAESYTSKVLRK